MTKQFWMLSLLATTCFGFAFAGQEKTGNQVQHSSIDTSNFKKDSLANINGIEEDMPEAISFEAIHPTAAGFVEDYIEKYSSLLSNIRSDRKPYLNMMDEVLTQHGIPKELKYLAIIESYLNPNARSGAGAVGCWQLMPATAKTLGLKVTSRLDERKNVYKSTHAASRYLTSLYSMYGDWLLVIAAYNSGPGVVNSAIKKSGSRNFWQLQRFLPLQSQKHVKKFIATHYFMEGKGSIATLTKEEAADYLLNASSPSAADITGTETYPVSGRYNASIIAKHLEMDITSFKKINPNFDQQVADNGKYELRLPADKMELFKTKKQEILNESVQLLLNAGNNEAETVSNSSY